ncbi:nucleotide exchange factor GrpE [Candidatus Gottesmanbacteria bacterium RIFCSPHIGHO2_01_FULL_39_10]|uniref:Protein GrpE n=1 Tax=Candidatus Gottesmanbacteria bacterium RIFCSPHIGHO2_01_FULL_39_10 TaxID=1798375 RepID=A0A1F5ZRR0_9BACT|nr:MAG: nucleotide exchange factor GrpE [Candidatus Gottesmanbacteria bacterium RIFCSPHIGHO2_01_FULL_39_10]
MLKKTDTNKEIADLKNQIEDLTNKWKRALADYQNLEKRTVARITDSAKYSAENIIIKLLPVLDTLEQAEKHIKDQGLALAISSFKDVLKSEGVEKVEVLGKKFEPREMEAIEVQASDKEDEVIEELRPGYRLGEKVIRVAQVKVSKKIKYKEE